MEGLVVQGMAKCNVYLTQVNHIIAMNILSSEIDSFAKRFYNFMKIKMIVQSLHASSCFLFSSNSCSPAQKIRTRRHVALVPTTTSCSENLNVRISEFPLSGVWPPPSVPPSPCVSAAGPLTTVAEAAPHTFTARVIKGPLSPLCPALFWTFHVSATSFLHTEVLCCCSAAA